MQATPLSTHTVLKLSKELPVVVEYHIPEVGRLAFYLAPKIEEEMNELRGRRGGNLSCS